MSQVKKLIDYVVIANQDTNVPQMHVSDTLESREVVCDCLYELKTFAHRQLSEPAEASLACSHIDRIAKEDATARHALQRVSLAFLHPSNRLKAARYVEAVTGL